MIGHLVARRLHGNVFVLVKIDARVGCAEQLQLDAFVARQRNGVVDVSTSVVIPFAAISTRSVVVLLMLLRWLLPTCIDRLLERLLDFSFDAFRVDRRSLLLLVVAIAWIGARRASEGARTTTTVVPIAAAASALRSVTVLKAVVVVVRLAIEIGSTAWLKVVVPLIEVVEATIVISKKREIRARRRRIETDDEKMYSLLRKIGQWQLNNTRRRTFVRSDVDDSPIIEIPIRSVSAAASIIVESVPEFTVLIIIVLFRRKIVRVTAA